MKKYLLCWIAVAGVFPSVYAQSYTLRSCLELGLERNYAVRISRNEEAIERNNATRANAGYLPEIDLSAGYGGNLDNTRTTLRSGEVEKPGGSYDQNVDAGVGLAWTVFEGFKVQATYDRLLELEKQGELNTRITIEDFVADLTAEYYNFIQQKIRLNNFRYAVSLSKERLRIAEARYNVRNYSGLDVKQAQVDFNADSSQYMTQQELVHSSRIRLNELMAMSDVNQVLDIRDSTIRINTDLKWDVLLERMLETNASLLQAARNKTLAELDLKILESRNYPYVRMNTGYGYTLNRYNAGVNRQRQTLGWDVGVTVGMTIFDGNRRREQRNARIGIENAQLQREQLELSLKSDLSNFWQAYRNNIEVLKLEEENVKTARENYDIARDSYLRLGNMSGFEMREAQKSLLDAEERLLIARYNTKLCEISLLQLCGDVLSYLWTEEE